MHNADGMQVLDRRMQIFHDGVDICDVTRFTRRSQSLIYPRIKLL